MIIPRARAVGKRTNPPLLRRVLSPHRAPCPLSVYNTPQICKPRHIKTCSQNDYRLMNAGCVRCDAHHPVCMNRAAPSPRLPPSCLLSCRCGTPPSILSAPPLLPFHKHPHSLSNRTTLQLAVKMTTSCFCVRFRK